MMTMMMMMMKLLVTAFFLGSSLGFAPVPLSRHMISASTSILSSTSSNPIQGGETTTAVEGDDAFRTYSISNPLQQLAYRDTVVGDGEMIERGKVVTVAYEGRLMSNGYKFDFGTGYAFRFGEGTVIPGWEVGLEGMKVGGKRTLRIPPNLAYGDRGAKDKIPPGAHLEFDCELKGMASNPIEEAVAQFNMQPGRIITFGLMIILLAVSGSLPN